MTEDIKLKVMEALQEEAYKGIVRIDSQTMKELNVHVGDIIEIEGERKTVGIVDRAYPTDIGQSIIRMDGIIRKNAKIGIGELVKVAKADIKEAKSIVIAPAQKGVMVQADPEVFKNGLLGKAVVKGDLISLGGSARRRRTFSGSPFEDIFDVFEQGGFMGNFGFGGLKFIVVSTAPKDAVIITENTHLTLNPKAVDVQEDKEKIFDVTYEDVGGLEEEVTKVREMIELPMKHPELFKALGIDPPKGVLLHGPPGTGKTLLAKAVANETEANFIVINGPEIMNKFYGQSLPKEEKILVIIDNKLKRIPIGELVEKQPKNAKALSFDKEGKLIIKDISSFIKHKNKSKLVEIKTAAGKHIKVTDDHSVFSIGKDGIESVKTSNLIPGKSFIATPKRLPEPINPIIQVDLIELLKEDDYGITVRNIQHLLKKSVEKLGITGVADILQCKPRYTYDIISKNVGIGISKFVKLMENAEINFDKSTLQVSTKGKSLPALLILNEDLCTFLGLWIAEGSYTNKNEVRISIHESELKYFEQLALKLFGTVSIYKKPKSKGVDIIICSGILGKIMKNILGFNSGARTKKIPELIYNLDNKNLSAFLRGYISGDGSVNTKTPAPMVEISTESPELSDDIIYLLLRFGIIAKVYLRPNRQQRRMCFADFDNLNAFKNIGFIQPDKNEIIFKYTNTRKFSRRDQLPITGIVEEIVRSNNKFNEWKNSKSIGKNMLLELKNKKLESILNSDIYWDKVIEIRECEENPEYVYDISVPECENFIAGTGGIFAHNSEENIRKIFEEAEKSAPTIIFIDEIDAIAPKRDEVYGEVERRVVATLLTCMDGLKSRGSVVVIGATNRPNALDPALRRPGRFDREIVVRVPDKKGRLNILKIHTRNMPLTEDVKLERYAEVTHGFVGADVEALCKEAAMNVLRKILPTVKLKENEPLPKNILEQLKITDEDFNYALKIVRPSAMREVLVEKPDIHWNDIGGLESLKQELKEAVELPLKNPKAFKRLGIRPPRGVLLYGPPGSGKTLIAKAVANESEANFILVKGPELLDKFVGESEKGVRKVFEKARQVAPTIIFFDEIDALVPRRGMDSGGSGVTERVVNALLSEMDGLEELNDVIVLAATNRPDLVDPALLRPGRFDKIISTGAPDREARLQIFKIHTNKMPLAKDVNLDILADLTDGYMGSDVEAICMEAGLMTLRNDIKADSVSMKFFENAIQKIKPSVSEDDVKRYQAVEEMYIRKAKTGNIPAERSYFG